MNKPALSNEYTANNSVELLRGGKTYFEKLETLIEKAEKNIELHTYIFNDDYTGNKIGKALRNAASRNVQINILVDGYASQNLTENFLDEMKKAGISFHFFEPWLKSRHHYLGRRMHHKIITIDDKWALVGGINIADRYNDLPEVKAWLDFVVLVEGAIVPLVADYCRQFRNKYKTKKTEPTVEITSTNISKNYEKDCLIRIRGNDWFWHKNEISISYLELFHHAKEEILILCSYFIPGKVLRRLLASAAKKGVRIKVVMSGKSDVVFSKAAERWLYDWLLRNGIELYEYKSGILHGKLAVADRKTMTIGSYNLNNLSTYASIEFNLDIKNESFGEKTADVIQNIIDNDCEKITVINHRKNKTPLKQLSRWCSYQLLRLVLKIVTFPISKHH